VTPDEKMSQFVFPPDGMYVILYAEVSGSVPTAARERERVMIPAAVCLLLGYLLGTSNMSHYIASFKKVDMRSGGSKNLGASNALLMLGWPSAVAVALHDIGKSVIAVLLARFLFPEFALAGVLAGVASVFGHIYPFYLKFKGGKGFASYLGMTLALNWKFALAVLIGVVVITVVTDYIVLATTTTVTVVPVYIGITLHSLSAALILLTATATILWKHKDNYVRIANGTEIGLRAGAFKKKTDKQHKDEE